MKTLGNVLLFLFGSLSILACQTDQKDGISYENRLQENWKISPANATKAGGKSISKNAFDASAWTEAKVPGTILHHLKESGKYENLYFGKNLEKIDTSKFRQPWWYHRKFEVNKGNGNFQLLLKGINYKADLWLNGEKIANKTKINNAFRQYAFSITKNLQEGQNTLAFKIYPPKPGDFSIGFVDWNPTPPDQNMGIFRDVVLKKSGAISMKKPFVVSQVDTATLDEAKLTVSTRVTNHSNSSVTGDLVLHTRGDTLQKNVSLPKNTTTQLKFHPENYQELIIQNPDLWWPADMGEPTLHSLEARFVNNNQTSDKQSIQYGIRTVSDYYTEDGHRGFKVNGKKILIKGGGWVDDLLLGNTDKNIRSQLEYVRQMNLNTVRLEGFWGKDQRMYDICDSLGILIMAGWSCHWEWSDYLGASTHPEWGGITSPEEINLMTKAWRDQVTWLRNHPSIFTWLGGSDMYPKPELEKNYLEIFEKYDSTRVFLPSAKEWEEPISGPSGVKMRSPYAYTPPMYWYTDTMYGGAFGFNTETGPGAQVPVYESIVKMIPEKDLWPPNEMWEYHCGRNEFNTLDRYNKAMKKRYGWPDNVKRYAMKAQVLNYELMRPMFEAFSVNKYSATGVIQWMLNSAWPEMYWQLYDSYLMPTGAFYAARKASAPLHLIYNYGDNGVYLSNDHIRKSRENLQAVIKVFDLNGEILHEKSLSANIASGNAKKMYSLKEYLPSDNNVRFVRLKLLQNEKTIHQHLYWLSGKKDKMDYETEVTPWTYYTPSKQYADFKELNELPNVELETDVEVTQQSDGKTMTVEVSNESGNTAFFTEFVLKNERNDNVITPVFWSDNFITLFPGETRELEVNVSTTKDLKLDVRGWNIPHKNIY